MSLVKTTATGESFLKKTLTGADVGYANNLSMWEKQVGADGVANLVFTLTKPFRMGSHTLLIFVNGQLAEEVDTLPGDPVQNLYYKELDNFTVQFDAALLDTDVVTFIVVGTVDPPIGEGNLIPIGLSITSTYAVAGYRYLINTTSFSDASPLILNLPTTPAFGATVGIHDVASNFNVSRLRLNSVKRIMGSTTYPNEYTMDVTTLNASFKLVFFDDTYGWRII